MRARLEEKRMSNVPTEKIPMPAVKSPFLLSRSPKNPYRGMKTM